MTDPARVPNERWSLDFVHDRLRNNRRFRVLAVGDDCTRENLALEADFGFSGERMSRVLDALPHFIDPGKPTQNANIESLDGKIRDELLNLHSFTTIFEACCAAEAWRNDYNDVRPHSALYLQTPRELADRFKTNHTSQLSAA